MAWAVKRATDLDQAAVGPQAITISQEQDQELESLLQAHELAGDDSDSAAALMLALFSPMRRAIRPREHTTMLRHTLDLDLTVDARVRLLNQLAQLLAHSDRESARPTLDEALELLGQHPELDPTATWLTLGNIELLAGRREASQAWYERALALVEVRGGQDRNLPTILNNLAGVAISSGRLGDAREHLRRALAAHEDLGSLQGVALARLNLGDLALAVRDHDEARRHHQAASDAFAQAGDRMRSMVAVARTGLVELDRGHPRSAETTLGSVLVGLRSGGFLPGIGETLTWMAVARAEQGAHAQAERLLSDAAEVYERITRRRDEARVHVFLGALQALRGATDETVSSLDRAMALLAASPDPRLQWSTALVRALADLSTGQDADPMSVLDAVHQRQGKRTPAGTGLEIRVLARWLERALAEARDSSPGVPAASPGRSRS